MVILTGSLLLGLLIGLSLGALGGGGSILTVPALVYLLGESARAATAGSLVIVGVTALIGAFGHTRSGNVRWLSGILFGITGVAASWAGTAANRHVDPNILLLTFAALMLIAAAGMLRRAATPSDAGRNALASHPAITPRGDLKFIAASLLVGFLTGFLGVGGGFIIVPALVVVLDFPMPVAVGTSLLIIALNSVVALVARAGHMTFDWSVILPPVLTPSTWAGPIARDEAADRPRPASERGLAWSRP